MKNKILNVTGSFIKISAAYHYYIIISTSIASGLIKSFLITNSAISYSETR